MSKIIDPPFPPHLVKASYEFKGVVREKKQAKKSAKKRSRDKKAAETMRDTEDGAKEVKEEAVEASVGERLSVVDSTPAASEEKHKSEETESGRVPLSAATSGVGDPNKELETTAAASKPDSVAPIPNGADTEGDTDVAKKKKRKRRKRRTANAPYLEDGLGLDEDSPSGDSPMPGSSPPLSSAFAHEEREAEKEVAAGTEGGMPQGSGLLNSMGIGAGGKTTLALITETVHGGAKGTDLWADAARPVCLVTYPTPSKPAAPEEPNSSTENRCKRETEERRREREREKREQGDGGRELAGVDVREGGEEEEKVSVRKRLHMCGYCNAEETSAKSFKRCQK